MAFVLLAVIGCNEGEPLVYRRFLWSGTFAEDHDAMLDWYSDDLGFGDPNGWWWGLADLSSTEVLPGGTGANGGKDTSQQPCRIAYEVADLDAQLVHLDEIGAASGAIETVDDVRRLEVTDIEGNRFWLVDTGAGTGAGFLSMPWGSIAVEDFETLRAWYRDTLGLTEKGPATADRTTFVLESGGILELTSGGVASDSNKSWAQQATVLGVEVEALKATLDVLEARGVALSGEIVRWKDDWNHELWSTINDPEGNEINLKENLDD